MNTQCQRCLKFTDGVHNCQPTEWFARLEAEIQQLKAEASFHEEACANLESRILELSEKVNQRPTDFPQDHVVDANKMVEFKVGDRVRVARKVLKEVGWVNQWIDAMDEYIGNEHVIRGIDAQGIFLSGSSFGWPASALDIVPDKAIEQVKDPFFDSSRFGSRLPPEEIMDAARKVDGWFRDRGITEWALDRIQARREEQKVSIEHQIFDTFGQPVYAATISEITDALDAATNAVCDANGGYMLTTYEALSERIKNHGIALLVKP